MQNLLLVRAASRLGMKFIPHGGTKPNLGVEKGPLFVLDNFFIKTLNKENNCTVLDFSFSAPESMSDDKYYSVVAEDTNIMAKKIGEKLSEKNYSRLVTVGGDHSIALGSVLAVLRTHKDKRVGIIDFDSHADIHMVQTSPSGNFHGMWLRPLLGDFDNAEIASIIDVRLPTEQLLYIGNLLTEDEEENFIQTNNIVVLDRTNPEMSAAHAQKTIETFCKNIDILHVTFDIDVFKEELVRATGTPNPHGFDADMVEECLKPIAGSGKLFSLDVVEVNPEKTGGEQTILLAQKIIQNLI